MRVAFSGKAGAGKTSLAEFLAADHGFIRYSFAGALKAELSRVLDLSIFELTDIDKKQRWRSLMQEWGGARRYIDESYWVLKIINSIKERKSGVNFVIDDLRYVNEANALQAAGFVLVRLECPSIDSIDYMQSLGASLRGAADASKHESETDLDEYPHFDHIIEAPRSKPITEIYNEVLDVLSISILAKNKNKSPV